MKLVSSCTCTWGASVPVMVERNPSCPQHGNDSAHWKRIEQHLRPKDAPDA